MTQITQPHPSSLIFIPPAQLWIGPAPHLSDLVKEYLQKKLCSHKGCNVCTTCTRIRDEQHHAIVWIKPEKQYSVDDLEPLFKQIAFQLESAEQFFFILYGVDFLTTTCANALLKSIEEPPTGYHFILLAQRLKQILPTIRSRCVVSSFSHDDDEYKSHPLFAFFTGSQKSPIDFMKIIDQSKITERESIELFDTLLNHWMARYKNAAQQQNLLNIARADKIIKTLNHASKELPMPGSSKLFWKNLFLQLHPSS
jgi:DNA polymerase-3 subunit delta'